jgi:outer membrane protein assembly factor BamB
MIKPCPSDALALAMLVLAFGLGPSARADDASPEAADATPADRVANSAYDSGARDAVDASASHDAKAAARLQRAESLIDTGKPDRALEVLLYTLERAEGAMVRKSDGSLAPVAAEASRLLGTLPAATLDLYRRQFGPAAEKALAEATSSGRRDLLEKIATQFRHTSAGSEAVRRLAAMHFDRGEFALASRRYRELLPDGLEASLRLRAAYAATAAGQEENAAEFLSGIDESDLTKISPRVSSQRELDDLIAQAASSGSQPILDDWRSPFGNPSATAISREGDPVLLRRWHHPLTHRASLQTQIDRLTEDLRSNGKSAIPAAIPLAIGDRVVSRTLRGVSVYAVADGRLLWETEEGMSPERMQSDGAGLIVDPTLRQMFRLRGQFGPDPSQGITGNYQPLVNAVFRDAVYGHISADLQRLYVVENTADEDDSVARFNGNPFNVAAGEAISGRASNRLVAYQLDSGRLAWPEFGGLGGDLADGPFEPPLAGYFFFGPPTSSGNELFVIGEAEKEIRLVALDPESGQPRWIRPIAEAQTGIERDPLRQLWPAEPAVSDGVIVCPTTVGWLVGIEQASRSVLWAVRYSPPQETGDANARSPVVSPAAWSSRWGPAAPVIYGGKVYFTPAEDARLVCLDLATGETAWQRGKGTSLYVAGVSGDLLIVVGPGSVDALDVSTGATRWSASFPEASGGPSGRAVLTAHRVYVPLHGDDLLTVDLDRGEVVEETQLPPGEGSLGNLLLHRGTLLSLSTDGLTAFEERKELVRSAEDRLKTDPRDAEALFREAQLQHADGHLEDATATLDKIDPNRVPDSLSEPLRRLRWDVLTALVRSDTETFGIRLDELKALARTADEQFQVRRLSADRSMASSNFVEAAKAYLALLDSEGDRVLSEENGRRTIRVDLWIAGRFKDLWDKTDGPSRTAVDRLIEQTLHAATVENRSRLASIFAFHPAAVELERTAAEAELAAKHLFEAEARLLRLSQHADGSVAARALLELAAAAREQGLDQDAAYWLERAGSLNPEIHLSGGDSSPSAVEPAQPASLKGSPGIWGQDYHFTVVRSGGYIAAEQSAFLRPDFAELPFFRDRTLRLLQPDRLAISGRDGAGLDQFVPLHVGNRSGARTVATADGHMLFVVYRGMLQAISAVEGRLLWSFPISDDGPNRYPSYVQSSDVAPMRPAGGLVASSGLVSRARLSGPLVAANASYAAVQERRDLWVLDPVTGQQRWTRTDLSPNSTLVGTRNLIYVLPRDGRQAQVMRALDGKIVELPRAVANVGAAVAAVGDRLLLATQEPKIRLPLGLPPFGGGTSLSLYDPIEDRAVWSEKYPADTLFDFTSGGRLCILTPDDGRLALLDAASGKTSTLGQVPPDVLRRRSDAIFLEDRDNTYLIVNVGRSGSAFTEVQAVAVNGEVFAFEKTTGELRWRHEIARRRLMCEDFTQLPALLFVDNDRTQRGNQDVWRVNLFAIDKRTGETVLDEPHYMTSTPVFRGFSVQPERRSIELTSYNTRLRLQAVPNLPGEASEAGETAAEPKSK